MSNIIKKLIFKLSGNRLIQNILEKILFTSQYFMGIGPDTSTEANIFCLIENESPIIFDVGANQGQFATKALNSLKKNKGAVYSFEPSKYTYDIMKKNISNDKHKTFNIGLGKKKEILKLYYDASGSGLASLTKRDLSLMNVDFNKSENVQIDTIDNFCKEHNIESIDLLKIDVEGHELDVLDGALNTFSKVKIVMFEFGGCNIDTKTYFRDFYTFFNNRKMDIYRITPSGYLYKLDKYTEMYEQFRTTNFIAK